MKGMILAAGYGTRFRPATYEMAKPLVPLCNKPLIDYACQSLVRAGVDQVIVNVHHLPDEIREHMIRTWSASVRLHFSVEEEILGTGGGIRRVRDTLQEDEDFLLVNGDTVQFPPLEELVRVRRETSAVASLLLRHPPAGDRYTSVFFDGQRVTGFGHGQGEPLMFAGSHCISRRVFDLLPDRPFSGITEDVYFPLVSSPGEGRVSALVHDGPWFDIGTPLRYRSASDSILAMMIAGEMAAPDGSLIDGATRVLADATARVEGAVRSSVLAPRSVVRPQARVEASVLWSGARVEADSVVERSILCADVSIGPGAHLVNALVCNRRDDVEYDQAIHLEGRYAWVPIDSAAPAEFLLNAHEAAD